MDESPTYKLRHSAAERERWEEAAAKYEPPLKLAQWMRHILNKAADEALDSDDK